MFTRWIHTALAIAIFALLAVGAHADYGDDVICGGLAESDCQILKDNAIAMESLESFAFHMTMTMDVAQGNAVANMPGMSGIDLSLEAQGSLSIDPMIVSAMIDLTDQLEESPSQFLSPDSIAALDSFIVGLTGDIMLKLHLVAGGETTQVEMRLLMMDGVFVLDAGGLEDLMGQPMQGMDWMGLDANGVISLLAADPNMTEALLGSIDDTTKDGGDLEAAEEAATSVRRLADSEVNGVAVAVFESSVDLGLLADLFIGFSDPQGLMDAADLVLTRKMLVETELTMWQYIGLSDHYTYRTVVEMGAGGGNAEGDGRDKMGAVMSVLMTGDQSDFNEPVVVEIPQDAFVMPLAMLMQMNN